MDFKVKLAYSALGAVIIPWGIVGIGLVSKNVSQIKYERPRGIIETQIAILCKDDYIAEHIAKSKYPLTLAAIAKVESDCRPQIKGDSGDSIGLYQIQPKHFGMVPDSVEGQTHMAEHILDDLIARYGYVVAIERYNGQGKQARLYRKKVLDNVAKLSYIIGEGEKQNGQSKKKEKD